VTKQNIIKHGKRHYNPKRVWRYWTPYTINTAITIQFTNGITLLMWEPSIRSAQTLPKPCHFSPFSFSFFFSVLRSRYIMNEHQNSDTSRP
jgi:hypothetical protein